MAVEGRRETQLGDLPEHCLAHAITLTSPRDAARCTAVSPAFRAAADSDHVWHRFIPSDVLLLLPALPPAMRRKDAYLGLCDAANAAAVDGGCRVWLDRATGAKCYALSARSLSLPCDDGSWKFRAHPLARFPDVAKLVHCTDLDIYGRLPAAALTPATSYAAYLVYDTKSERGLNFPLHETTVSLTGGGGVAARHTVCLLPDDDAEGSGDGRVVRRPRRREDGLWEMEMGRVMRTAREEEEGREVMATLESVESNPKSGLILHGIEFSPLHDLSA